MKIWVGDLRIPIWTNILALLIWVQIQGKLNFKTCIWISTSESKKRMSAFGKVWLLKNPNSTPKMPLHLSWLTILVVFSGITALPSAGSLWQFAHLKICTNHTLIIHSGHWASDFLYPASHHCAKIKYMRERKPQIIFVHFSRVQNLINNGRFGL